MAQFKNIWLVLPSLLIVLYVPQALWGLHLFGDKSAMDLTLILMLGLLVYCGTYMALKKIELFPSYILTIGGPAKGISTYFVPVVTIIYFLLIGYVLLTAQKIALLEAFRGASADDITFARETLFKTRVGWEKTLPYLNAVFSSALMPFALMISYIEGRRYRHWLFLLFCLSLLPSLEKALILKAMVPLIMLGLNGYLPKRRILILIGLTIISVGIAFSLTKAGSVDYLTESHRTLARLRNQQEVLPTTWSNHLKAVTKDGKEYRVANDYYVDFERKLLRAIEFQEVEIRTLEKYSPLGYGPTVYKINRSLWIPYVTAYDWILYFNDRLDGQFLKGATSSLLAELFGRQRFLMEREVFKFQFGDGGVQTATANAVFLVDAFVNFGWLGVTLYAFLLASLIYMVTVIANPAMQACLYYFLIQISMGGLPGVLFSNGMLLLILISLFIKPKQELEKIAKTTNV